MVVSLKEFEGYLLVSGKFLKGINLKVSVMLRVNAIPHNVVLHLDISIVLIYIYYYPLNNLECILYLTLDLTIALSA